MKISILALLPLVAGIIGGLIGGRIHRKNKSMKRIDKNDKPNNGQTAKTTNKFLCSFAMLMFVAFNLNAANRLTAAQKACIVTRFGTEVKYNFAHSDRMTCDWDSLYMARLPHIVDTPTDEAFLDSLKLLCATLRDGHTAVWNTKPAVRDWPLPFFTKRFGDRVFVTDVITDKMTAAGIRPGTEILEIDDMPVIEYGEKNVIPYFPSSTPQWSMNAAYFGGQLTNGPADKSLRVKFRNPHDSVFTLNVERDMDWQHNPYYKRVISYKRLPGNVGYIRIPSFQQGLFDHEKFIKVFDSLQNASSMIIDIRDNGGGNSVYGDFVLRFISPDTIPALDWSSPKYIPVLKAWGAPEEPYTEKGSPLIPFSADHADIPRFEAPVVLLVNSNTFSASEDFAALFKSAKRGTVIGSPTGGSTGQPIMIDLGYGYMARICARDEWLPDGTEFIGIGIIPDVTVEETPDIFSGKDVVLERALEFLSFK